MTGGARMLRSPFAAFFGAAERHHERMLRVTALAAGQEAEHQGCPSAAMAARISSSAFAWATSSR
jgi:hypothetical protein